MIIYLSSRKTANARVVELADSLDSGSSVHSGRAGSSPASRTKIPHTRVRGILFISAPKSCSASGGRGSIRGKMRCAAGAVILNISHTAANVDVRGGFLWFGKIKRESRRLWGCGDTRFLHGYGGSTKIVKLFFKSMQAA